MWDAESIAKEAGEHLKGPGAGRGLHNRGIKMDAKVVGPSLGDIDIQDPSLSY